MALTLKIENETSLPDGGPLSVSVQGKRGIDIGRDQYLDWTLPDPTRTISGKHCEVRWHDGAYWLHDVSRNGTFLYGADSRLKEPHRLRNGDRFAIGHYIIVAAVEDEGPASVSTAAEAAIPNYDEIWNPVGEAAPPIDPKLLKDVRDFQPVKPDFLQWAVDVPTSYNQPAHAPPLPAIPTDDMTWARGTIEYDPAKSSDMALTLKIENETSLPDGGPLSVSVQGKRGIDIGRDQYLDWTLPDPTRSISGKHCEVRWHDGAYWLHDVSRNGTFLYGADSRLKEPHRLRNGDRFAIGHYIIVAAVEDEGPASVSTAEAAIPNYDEIWNPVGETAPPTDSKPLKDVRDFQPVKPDFLQWAVDTPTSYNQPALAPPLPAIPTDDMTWARGTARPQPPEPELPPVPTPRRPIWLTEQPNGPWAAPAAGPAPALPSHMGAALAEPRLRDDLRKASPPGHETSTSEFIRQVALGAGLPENALAARDPSELAAELGQFIRLLTENTKQLLEARQQAKRLTRSSNQTTVQALNNNPLKFAPTTEDALRIMFGPPTQSYLNALHAFTQSFDDLKSHQVKTLSAMQHALRKLLADVDPEVIDKTSKDDRGLVNVLGSRRARLWDIYSTRWRALTQGNEDGMLNAFMNYFAEFYDLEGKDRR